MATLEQIKKYTILKRRLAKSFKITEKLVQKAVDTTLQYMLTNGGMLTPSDFVALAQADTTELHDIFDWDNTLEYRIGQAKYILDSVEFFISSDGKIYSFTKGEV